MSQRRFHKDSRLSENFTEQGLQSLTGESRRYWARYVVKELVDNALEAAEGHVETPRLEIDIETTDSYPSKITRITVSDNGPGIPEKDMAAVFEDISSFAGSKRHYCLPTRGNQGNALMTILGIQYLSGGPLVVETDGMRHMIRTFQDATDEWQIERDTEPCDVSGTRIVVDFDSAYYCKTYTVEETLAAFVALNPHVSWRISLGGYEQDYLATECPSVDRFSPRGDATTGKALWFSYDDFTERLKADARADETLTVDDVVSEFSGLTSRNSRNPVFDEELEECRQQSLLEFLEQSSESQIRHLYESMVQETSTYSERNLDSTLGSVGGDLTESLHNYLQFIAAYDDIERLASNLSEYSERIENPTDITLYNGDGAVVKPENHDKAIPFYFEFAVIPKSDESADTDIEFGINQSVSYSTPNISVEYTANGKTYRGYSISAAFEKATNHPYHIVTNLTCPNLDFQDKGKQSFDTEPFEEVVSDVVGKTVRKIGREIRPRLNDLRSDDESEKKKELEGKAHHGFIKEFIFNNFEDAYEVGTDGGEYSLKKRQHYYILRPWFFNRAEELGYKYKHSATVDEPEELEFLYGTYETHVDTYESEVLGERVLHRQDRGFFIEPHSNKKIDLQTVDVERYEPDLNKFDTLLLIEKQGFAKMIHQEFELTKRYDVGLINSQGYNTIAGRDLIEKVQARDDVELLILSDLDIDGLTLADDATKPDETSTVTEFDATRIGIDLEDVREYDLPPESRNYRDKKLTQLQNKVDDGVIDPEVANFLRSNGGQAVEINALTPPQLKNCLESKFHELGIDKVVPDEEDIENPEELQEDAVEKAVGKWVRSQTKDKLVDKVEESLESVDTSREEIRSRIIDFFDEHETEGWEDIESYVQEDIKMEWREEVIEYLEENVTVEVEID